MADQVATLAGPLPPQTGRPSPLRGTLVGAIAVVVWATGGPVITFAP